MGSEQDKWPRERAAFLEFIAIAGLPIPPDTVQKRSPPEPDLLCQHTLAGTLAFELVEICDPTLAKALAQPGRSRFIATADPSVAIVGKKLGRSYQTPYPIELICYTDGRVVTPVDVLVPTLVPVLSSYSHGFRRIWLLADGEVHVLHSACG